MFEVGKLYKGKDNLAYITPIGEVVELKDSIVMYLGVFKKHFFNIDDSQNCSCFLLLSRNIVGWWIDKYLHFEDYEEITCLK